MTPYEIFFILFFFILVIVGLVVLYRSFEFHKNLTSKVITRGLNGIQGQNVSLTCPPGQKISVYKANYVCTSNQSFESSTCDPFWSTDGQLTNFFNPVNTYDVSDEISKKCNGGNSCTWTIPSGSGIGICQQQTPNSLNGQPCSGVLQLIGTYDCTS
jgi:hypothetical protein